MLLAASQAIQEVADQSHLVLSIPLAVSKLMKMVQAGSSQARRQVVIRFLWLGDRPAIVNVRHPSPSAEDGVIMSKLLMAMLVVVALFPYVRLPASLSSLFPWARNPNLAFSIQIVWLNASWHGRRLYCCGQKAQQVTRNRLKMHERLREGFMDDPSLIRWIKSARWVVCKSLLALPGENQRGSAGRCDVYGKRQLSFIRRLKKNVCASG